METGEMNEEILKVVTKNKTRIVFCKNTVLLKGLYETIECAKAYISNKEIFYETKIGDIYKLKKQRLPKKIGNGKLVGVIDETVVWKNKSNIFVHSKNKTKKTVFKFYKDNTVKYSKLEKCKYNEKGLVMIDSERNNGIELIQDISVCVYMEYLVMGVNNILYFVSLRNKETVKYKKDKIIRSIKVKSVIGIKLLWVCDWESHFYRNEEVAEDKAGISGWGWATIQIFKELNSLEQILLLNMCEVSAIALEQAFLRVIGKTKTITEFIEKSKGWGYKRKDTCGNIRRTIVGPNGERNANIEQAIKKFIKKRPIIFEKAKCSRADVFKEYYSENVTIRHALFVEKTIQSLAKFAKINFFYEDIFPLNYFLEKSVINEKSAQFLENKYKRVFSYDKNIQSCSKNLAYRTIATIKKHSRNAQSPKLTQKLFFKALRTIFKDTRANEIFDILTENSIVFDRNSLDFEPIRMECFKYRVFACAGSLLLPTGEWGFEYSINLFCNKLDFLKDVDKNFLFFFFAANHNAIIETTPENKKILVLASGFGKSIAVPGTSSQIFELITILNPNVTKDNAAHYILLALASVSANLSAGQIVPRMDTNRAFLTYLKKKDLAAKLTAMACLAIYNFNSQDKNIFSTLLAQCAMSGPIIHEERCLDYYTSQYRVFAAVSAATVHSVKSPVILDDKLAELLLNGLSFIGTCIYSSYMKRYSSARPAEVFYGELFYLLNSFSLSIDDAIDSISDSLFSANPLEQYQFNIIAARVFYIAFKALRDRIFIEKQSEQSEQSKQSKRQKHLYDWFYKVIDHTEKANLKNRDYKIVFDFSLIAFSLICNSSFDLRLLTIIRRQILATVDPYDIYTGDRFNMTSKSMQTYYGPGFESIHYYKICMAIVCAGLGTIKLNLSNQIDYKIIIVTFFYSDLPLFLFRQIDYFKFLLPKVFVANTAFITKLKRVLKKNIQKGVRKKISRKFCRKFNKKSDFDKKFIIDIFSDFIENYATKTNLKLFDLNSFAKIITVTK